MTKDQIIAEIQRTAEANGGVPLGRERFERETGVKESQWLGKFWIRWNDAVREAGYVPNAMNRAHPVANLLRPLAALASELGHFPTQPEMNYKRRTDSTFPSPDSIRRRFGNKSDLAKGLLEFAKLNPEFAAVAHFCVPHVTENLGSTFADDKTDLIAGYVYLLKHGNEYKIGRSTDPTRRYREIKVQMPLDTEEIHIIETDDCVGIESYWHNRFSNKRLNGEWFRLTSKDVNAFKKRKFM